ncbi:MAG: thioester domain-containing protein, partial [Acidimicrobiia bacterium]
PAREPSAAEPATEVAADGAGQGGGALPLTGAGTLGLVTAGALTYGAGVIVSALARRRRAP